MVSGGVVYMAEHTPQPPGAPPPHGNQRPQLQKPSLPTARGETEP